MRKNPEDEFSKSESREPNLESNDELRAARILGEYMDRKIQGENLNLNSFLGEIPEFGSAVFEELQTFDHLNQIIDDEDIDKEFGDYRLKSQLPGGGMAVVYEAVQTSLNRPVALKILPPQLIKNDKSVGRFGREAQVIAKLNHPNIVKIHETGVTDDTPYIAMELIEGQTIQGVIQRIKEEGSSEATLAPFRSSSRFSIESIEETKTQINSLQEKGETPSLVKKTTPSPQSSASRLNKQDCLRIAEKFSEVADALQHAHSKNVYHRDIKPSNLILDESGKIRILDFGLALVDDQQEFTKTRDTLGTIPYMPPEQAGSGGSNEIGPGSDIFSLGVTLFETLSWERPFQGDTTAEIIHKVIHSDPQSLRMINPNIPKDLETIVLHCLEKNKLYRYKSADGLALDLRRVSRGEPPEIAKPLTQVQKVRRKIWKHRRLLLEATAGLLLVSLLMWLLVISPIRAERKNQFLAHKNTIRNSAIELLLPGQLLPVMKRDSLQYNQQTDPYKVKSYDDTAVWGWYNSEAVLSFLGSRWVLNTLDSETDSKVKHSLDRLQSTTLKYPEDIESLYYLAQGYEIVHDLDTASRYLKQILAIDPAFTPALVSLKNLKNSSPELRLKIDSLIDSYKSDSSKIWVTAINESSQGNWIKAAESFEKYLNTPNGKTIKTSVLLKAALARLYTGDSNTAQTHVQSAFEPEAKNFDLFLFKGAIALAENDPRAADRIFAELESSFELDDSELEQISSIYAGALLYKRSLNWIQKIKNVLPKHQRHQFRMLMRIKGHDKNKREKILQALLKSDPTNYENELIQGEFQELYSDTPLEKAIPHYEEAKRLKSDSAIPLVAKALCYENNEKLNLAESELRTILKEDGSPMSDLWLAKFHLARILSNRTPKGMSREDVISRWQKAEQIYKKLKEEKPNNPLILNNYAVHLDQQGRLVEASKLYEEARNAHPLMGLTHFNLAWSLHRRQLFGEAILSYDAAYKYGIRDFPEIYENRGTCLLNEGFVSDAEADFIEAQKFGDRAPLATRNIGNIYRDRGEINRAIEQYEKTIKLVETPENHSLLGEIHTQTENYQDALAAFEKALELDPYYLRAAEGKAYLLLGPLKERLNSKELKRTVLSFEELASTGFSPILELLDRSRTKLLPSLITCSSVDWLFEQQEVLIDRNETWSYSPYTLELSESPWQRNDFDISNWKQAQAPFGFSKAFDKNTDLSHLENQVASICFVKEFQLAQTPSELFLKIRIDDGFIAYINGEEVERFRVPLDDSQLNSPETLASDYEGETWQRYHFKIQPKNLIIGKNRLSIRAFVAYSNDVDMLFGTRLTRGNLNTKRIPVEIQNHLSQPTHFESPEVHTYALGRIQQKLGNFEAAKRLYKSVLGPNSLPKRPIEFYLRLGECHLELDQAISAETVYRKAIENYPNDRRAWEAWIQTSFSELDSVAHECLDFLPKSIQENQHSYSYEADYRWLLEELAKQQPLRILSGGHAWRSGDTKWSRDRFFTSGNPFYLKQVFEIVDSPLYQTERYFFEGGPTLSGYKIPLPRGRYKVVLHFLEGYHEKENRRIFDVIVEGEPFANLKKLDLIALRGFRKKAAFTDEVLVNDGFLNIEFRRHINLPKINGIEIYPLDS